MYVGWRSLEGRVHEDVVIFGSNAERGSRASRGMSLEVRIQVGRLMCHSESEMWVGSLSGSASPAGLQRWIE